MTKTTRSKLVKFATYTKSGTVEWWGNTDGVHLTNIDPTRVDLDEWLEKQRTSGDYVEGQTLVANVTRYTEKGWKL
ncbi:MAG: hypothetical protein NTY75_02015 [Candidatus Shapirobacteria bacterium]|nr:hypothetical protein [Candidatus Shapirobacteria bacterium]